MVAAVKAGLSESRVLKKIKMELRYPNAFLTECILRSVSRPVEELELATIVFREYMLACMHSVSVYACTYICICCQ